VITLEELESRGELDEIIKVTGLSRGELLGKREKVLKHFLDANTKIMTIDSFFSQILRKFSLYAGLMPDFTTANAQHELKLLARFLKEATAARKKETLINLSLSSQKRVTALFSLLNELYSKKKELEHIKFQKENALIYEVEALGYLEELAAYINNCPAASSTAKNGVSAESFDALSQKSWLSRESLDYSTFKKCYVPDMDRLLEKIKEAIVKQNRAKEQNFFYGLFELLEIYVKAKEALYKEDGELSFDDVTTLVHYLLKERIESEFLYFRLDADIEHILLDEFQDTSILQYEILRPMIEEILSGFGVKEQGSFFFVGDVKQSIYRFRGGVSALFHEVAHHNHTKIEPLLTNYRSEKNIIEFVNKTFKEKIKGYNPQHTRAEANGGYVEVVENDFLLDKCLEHVEHLLSLGANPDDIAVLCATNGDGEAVKQHLASKKIAVVTETTTKLIHQQSVKAVLEYLKYLYFKEDIYRYNFFALIEKEAEPLQRINVTTNNLDVIIKNIVKQYGLFEGEMHLIRFLHAIKRYKDIESLLFEYERLDESSAASDLSGVRILTIHKSKGLEYEHVILLDRMKKAPPARDSIIYEYDGIRLENIYLRIKGRDAIDERYQNALEKEKNLAREDTLNALYVAFTRAKQNLFIIKKSKESMFSLLEMACESVGMLTCHTTKQAPKPIYEPFVYKNLYYGSQTEILASEQEKEEDLEAIHFGLALHYMLEMLPSFEPSALGFAKTMLLNKYGATLSVEEIADIEKRVTRLLENKEFLNLVKGKAYKEKGMKYKNSLRYIDLLIHQENPNPNSLFSESSWNIVDYKSSFAFSGEHAKQVKAYKNIVKTITKEAVEGYICYLLPEAIKIVKID
jgi:exodeoxyribonuclease V beta subunit